ncbi:MAG: hypothetical protein J6U21_00555 [Bacteroidales bacterium]|nr:hypothetical protein [Bacteroidales bacterium]
MKNILLIIFAFLSFSAFAQSNDSLEIVDLKKRVDNLERKLERQIGEIRSQQNALFNQQQKVNDSLKSQLSDQSQKSETLKSELNTKLDNTNSELDKNVSNLTESISSNKTIAIIGIIAAIVLLAIVFVILRSKISSKDSAIDKIRSAQDSLAAAQKSMQEESVKLDSKLVELLEKQMTAPTVETPKDSEPDHSLALKVADEIIRIETNLSKMDSSVKGYKQLSKAVERIRTNFMANGYEIVDMLNKPYNEGMKVTANFVSDESLADGEQKITGITKPQINYNGKMIQSAQITVSQNI